MDRAAFHDPLWFLAASSMYQNSLTMGASPLCSSCLILFCSSPNPPKKMSAIARLISLHCIPIGLCYGVRGGRNHRATSPPAL